MKKKLIILCTVILIVVMEALFALIGALMPGPFHGTVTKRRIYPAGLQQESFCHGNNACGLLDGKLLYSGHQGSGNL